MYTKYLVINNGSESQVVKNVRAVSPHVDRTVFPKALVIKAIHLGDLSALMIASNKSDSFRIPDLQGQKKEDF